MAKQQAEVELVYSERLQQLILVFSLSMVLLLSALMVVYTVHSDRQKTNALNALLVKQDQLHIEYGQLLLEQSAVGNFGLVEKKARHSLKMTVPSSREVVIVRR